MHDVSSQPNEMAGFLKFVSDTFPRLIGHTDGEMIDVLEHFFWGKKNGLAMELGALDGTCKSHSMTVGLEENFGWRRILIEGDPAYKDKMKYLSPQAYSINAAICEHHTTVHFAHHAYVGGIVEFMAPEFLKQFFPDLYAASVPPGNASSINWQQVHD